MDPRIAARCTAGLTHRKKQRGLKAFQEVERKMFDDLIPRLESYNPMLCDDWGSLIYQKYIKAVDRMRAIHLRAKALLWIKLA